MLGEPDIAARDRAQSEIGRLVSEEKVGRLRERRHAGAAGEQNGQCRADAPPRKALTTQHRPFRPLQAQKISLTLMRVARAARPAAAEPSHMLLNTVNERDGAFRR